MKHRLILLSLVSCLWSLTSGISHAERLPELPAITGSAVDPAVDLLLLNDTSAGAAGSKKITLAELVNVSSFQTAFNPLIGTGGLALSKIAQAGATTGQGLVWNGTAWAPSAVAASLTSGPVTSSGTTSAIADAALSIAKTSGLQAALDKATEVVEGVPSTGGADGDFRINGLTGVVYKKIAGAWTAIPATSPATTYAVTGTPSGEFGNVGDIAILYVSGEASSFFEKTGVVTWTTRGTFLKTTDSAPTYTTLTAVSGTVTQTCSPYKTVQNAKLTLAGAWTLSINSPVVGMRGTILITYTSGSLALPANSKGPAGFALSTSVGAIDQLEWVYDGTDFLFTLPGVSLQPPYRPETLAYIAAVGMTNDAHKLAFNAFIQGLVDDAIWSKFYAIWPFYGGTPSGTTHAKDLKATYTGAFASGVTYNGNGITGNGTTGWFDSNFNFAMIPAQNSAAVYVYCRTQTLAYATTIFAGGGTGNTNFGLDATSTGVIPQGTNSNLSAPGVDAGSDWRKHLVAQRTDSATATVYVNAGTLSNSHAATAANADDIFFLGGNYNGGGYATQAINLGLAATSQALTAGEWTNFRARVTTLMTALGRANP